MSITRVVPEEHVYRIQLLGHIMLVCPETFDRTSDKVDCERWLRRTRGGNTVFVQHKGVQPAQDDRERATLSLPAGSITTVGDIADPRSVSYSIRPRPRPADLAAD